MVKVAQHFSVKKIFTKDFSCALCYGPEMNTAQCQALLVLTKFADKMNRTFNIRWYVLYSMCMPLLTGSAFHHLAEKFTRRIEELGILRREVTSCSTRGTARNRVGVLFVSNTSFGCWTLKGLLW